MKVKALIDCVGRQYNLKANEEVTLDKNIANKLIEFGYVQEIKVARKKSESVSK
ncbi:hypothetical protein [Lysinibacillus sphaericus]|uniref:hypothetical protein n=1 Tax=Lysinibacillus sphaericus TaxID=1421 RepID=UPI003D045F65